MDRSRFKHGPSNRRAWSDWLSDDPPAPAAKQALRQARVQSATAYQRRTVALAEPVAAAPGKPDLTININLQKIKIPKPKLPKITVPRLSVGRMSLILAVLAVIPTAWYFAHAASDNAKNTATAASPPVRQSPSFQPVAPATKSQLGKFAAHVTSYDGRRDTYSYADSIAGQRITVSQQPLPSKLGASDEALKKIAAQTGASKAFDTGNGTAYLKTDQDTGAQMVVCSVNNILLFINSSTHFQEADWTKYINGLQ